MNAYIYQASLLCDACGRAARGKLDRADMTPSDPCDEFGYDSDDYPKGPYPNGGGEADSPNHCDHCGLFLENPLTCEGYRYLAECLDVSGLEDTSRTVWQPFYH